ncbi:glycosyltransferase family 2 protein [Phocaeicola sartorii]|jgi:glycosyltransferase involved in cell wall biosynthesis|uniref:glycosyltransferase family 2 protein n=1 Tax=Phocaeicola sartorii TaxID=671267 RepID=UPI002586A483|nr:glycosyltransferase family 2 protein [Phocaeicola sartorii]
MKVSVITINYNNVQGLKTTIQSVISQSYKDMEYIIVDGGSTDGSVDLLMEYSDKISKCICEPDNGVYNAMNKGVSIASGEYCIFMNSGDGFWNSDVLENIFSKHIDAGVLAGKTYCFKNGRFSSMRSAPKKITMKYLYANSINHQAMLIKTALLREYPYDETLKVYSDWKFCIQTLVVNNLSYQFVDYVIAKYDLSGVSANAKFKEEKQRVLLEYFPQRILCDYELLCKKKLYKALLQKCVHIVQRLYYCFFIQHKNIDS